MTRKLTDEQVLRLRELRAAGACQRDLATDFDISQAFVSEIVRGHRYPKVGGPIETTRRYIRRRPQSGG